MRINQTTEHVGNGNINKYENETVWLISSIEDPDPKKLLIRNRKHRGNEVMHRDKDVILGEDYYTNRLDNAPQNIFTLSSATRTVSKRINKSPTRAIEMVQDKRDSAIRLVTAKKIFL